MKNSKLMLMIVSIMLLAVMIIMPSQVKAVADDKLAVVNASSGGESSYLIYVDGLLNQPFEFALSNDKSGNGLIYVDSATDSENKENHIAYYAENNTVFKDSKLDLNQPVYIWVKDNNGNIVLNAQEVDLKNCITTDKLNDLDNITKRIPVITNEQIEDSENKNGIKITTIVGSVKIKAQEDEDAKYYYQMIKIPAEEDYNQLWALLTRMNTEYNNDSVSDFNKIQLATDFSNLYEKLINNAKWEKVKNYTIEQPEDAEDGTQYILFLKKETKNEETYDVQFLTSAQEPFENYENIVSSNTIVTKRTSKLPITYDSMILWAVLAVIIIALIVVRSRMKKSKKESKH